MELHLTDTATWSWIALLALGAFHGINPGMGWLFAVALGMQEQSRAAVWRALLPLGLGHGLAIAAAILAALAAGIVVPVEHLRWPVAAILAGMGISRLFRHRHPRWASMRVGMKGLTVWSFLMANAHGAGLMVLPVFLGMTTAHAAGEGPSCHTSIAGAASAGPMAGLLATAVHSAGYLLITALAAWIVYEKLGVGLLRRAWVNLDLVWAVALIITGGVTFLL
jgi:hypothetical protein